MFTAGVASERERSPHEGQWVCMNFRLDGER